MKEEKHSLTENERKPKHPGHINNRKKKKEKRQNREEMRLLAGCGCFELNQKPIFILRQELTENISLPSPEGERMKKSVSENGKLKISGSERWR